MKLSFFGAAHAVTGSCHCLEVNGKRSSSTAGFSRAGTSTTTTPGFRPRPDRLRRGDPRPHRPLRPAAPAGEGGVPGADLHHPSHRPAPVHHAAGLGPSSRRATPSGRTRRASGPAVTQWSLSTPWPTRRPPLSSSIPWSTARCWTCARGPGPLPGRGPPAGLLHGGDLGHRGGEETKKSSSPATWATSTSPSSATPVSGRGRLCGHGVHLRRPEPRAPGELCGVPGPAHRQDLCPRGGNVIIPPFAVGRTQELLYFLREIKQGPGEERPPSFQVCVDSPLAAEATRIYSGDLQGYLDEEAIAVLQGGENLFTFPGLTLVQSTDESKALNMDQSSKVIISASGMRHAGRSATT